MDAKRLEREINAVALPIICVMQAAGESIQSIGEGQVHQPQDESIVQIWGHKELPSASTTKVVHSGNLKCIGARLSNMDAYGKSYKGYLIVDQQKQPKLVLTGSQPAREAKLTHAHDVSWLDKVDIQRRDGLQTRTTNQPRLIELHLYPGYMESEPTNVPHDVSTHEILTRVVNAQPHLIRHSSYKDYVEEQFLSVLSSRILKDVFWYCFLVGWHPDEQIQAKIVDRVANNYVQLLITCTHPHYGEPFLNELPSLLSQAVYAAYCEAFVDSYTQFDDKFKDRILELVFMWITGMKPGGRKWLKWDYSRLEPAQLWSIKALLANSTDFNVKESTVGLQDGVFSSAEGTLWTEWKRSDVVEQEKREKRTKNAPTELYSLADKLAPNYIRTLYDVYGRSPLVVHFLSTNQCKVNVGSELLIQRTELHNLPTLKGRTYKEVVCEARNSLSIRSAHCKQFHDRCTGERLRYNKEVRQQTDLWRKNEQLLLSRPKLVKQLSEILIREFLEGADNAGGPSKTVREAMEMNLNRIKLRQQLETT